MLRRAIVEGKIRVALDQATAPLPANLPDHVAGFRFDDSADHGHARLDNARLLPRDRRQGVSQLLRMVEADAGDDRDGRLADIGRIEPSAQADFKHGRPDLLS